ncbi:MAG: EAL and HDOD domain-containing protein, partial [Desulfovibrionaceae bacterium]
MSRAATPAVFERYYLARQPVFDREGGLWGYELLFRNGPDATEAVIDDQDLATFTVAVAGLMGGPIGAGDGAEGAGARSKAGSGRRILLNFTERLLLHGAPRALPPGPVVVEVLETVPPTPAVVTALAALKAEGYTIAIDDFEGRTDLDLLLDLADIIKVDLLHKDQDRIRAIYDMIRDKPALKLAEKVDDRDMLGFLRDLGFDLFQGYFFARPENLSGRKLNASEAAKLRILQRIEDPEAGPVELADSIKADPSVTYRLLRFLNSAA